MSNREQFENWCRKQFGWDESRFDMHGGEYLYAITYDKWQVWVAATGQLSPELIKVIDFLLGQGDIEGFEFGEHREGHYKFWWRKHLRKALPGHMLSDNKEQFNEWWDSLDQETQTENSKFSALMGWRAAQFKYQISSTEQFNYGGDIPKGTTHLGIIPVKVRDNTSDKLIDWIRLEDGEQLQMIDGEWSTNDQLHYLIPLMDIWGR